MAKLTLSDVTNLQGNPTSAQGTINANSAATETALENTLSRDGTSPNQMNHQLDMNSYQILNLPAPTGPNDVVRLQDMSTFAGGGSINTGISSLGSSTDNAIVRWNGTGGLAVQNSGVIVDDSNNVTGVVALTVSNGLNLSSTNVINWASGNATISHSTGQLAFTVNKPVFTISGNEFTIQGTGAASPGMLHIRPNSGSAGYITITETSIADKWGIGCDAGNTSLKFKSTSAAGVERFRIDNDGQITVSTNAAAGRTISFNNADAGGSSNITLQLNHGSGTVGSVLLTNSGFAFAGNTTISIGTSAAVGILFNTNSVTRMIIGSAGETTVRADVATPAGGSTSARLLFGQTSGFGVYYGSGAPSVSAAQGSIYLRSDGSSTSTRLYVNTNGSTTWTNVTTAA